MSNYLRAGFLAVAVLIAGCAATVSIPVKHASELNIVGVKTWKVDAFTMAGDLSLNLLKPTKNTAANVLVGIVVQHQVDKAAAKEHNDLLQNYRAEVIETITRDRIATVTENSEFDARLGGIVQYAVEDHGGDKEQKNSDGKVTHYYELRRKADVTVHISVLNKTGDVIAAAELKHSVEKSVQGDNQSEVLGYMSDWRTLVREALAATTTPLLHKLAAHTLWESRTLAEADSDLIKRGNNAAQAGDWDSAARLWSQARESGGEKQQHAALYNLAIYDEVQGRLADALAKLRDVYTSTGKDEYLKAIKRTERRIEEEQRLREGQQHG